MATGTGSYSERTEVAVSEDVRNFVKSVGSKDDAYVKIKDQYSRALILESKGIGRLTSEERKKWLIFWERASQLAMEYNVMPEIPDGYAYRLKLIGCHADSHTLRERVDTHIGLYRAEMMGESA